MALWFTRRDGLSRQAKPSDYVFGDMDAEYAHEVLGRLLDVLWSSGKLSDSDIVEIVGKAQLSTQPPPPPADTQ